MDRVKKYCASMLYLYRTGQETAGTVKKVAGNYEVLNSLNGAGRVDLVVSDMRDTTTEQMMELCRIAPVVSIDDLGAARKYSHACIYSLPVPGQVHGNFNGTQYLVLDERVVQLKRVPFDRKKGVLISFGGSDPGNLSHYLGRVFNRMGIRPTIIRGPFFAGSLEGIDAGIIDTKIGIHQLINNARVLITSFGLTMYEAFFLKTPVVLFNQSVYHSRLAEGLPVFNLGYPGAVDETEVACRLRELLENGSLLRQKASAGTTVVDGKGTDRVVQIITAALEGSRRDCLFGHKTYVSLARSKYGTLFKCRRCGDLFLYRLDEGSRYHNSEYFFSEYKNQYGKTYIEDRENIISMAHRRLAIIEKLKKSRGRILDIGCALGFFLEAARQRGWKAKGVEISEYASGYARKKLALDVITGSFTDVNFQQDSFDVVTLLYTAEHFAHFEEVVRKVYTLLKNGGLLVMALPNRGGISFLTDRKNYILNRPHDHFFDTNIRNLKKFLALHGFKPRKVCITGVHPHRFYKKLGMRCVPQVLKRAYGLVAKIFRLGDTFEYYGTKV